MARQHTAEDLIAEVQQHLEATDASAFLVLPRIVRRVIRHDADFAVLGLHVPHRQSCVTTRSLLRQMVDTDELGRPLAENGPDRAILIARPGEQQLADMDLPALSLYCWRLLFHSQVHAALDELVDAGRLAPTDIRTRVARIGQAEFDEISAVLRNENYLPRDAGHQHVYIEFAAVYLELRAFAPHWLPTYFPSISDFEQIDEVLRQDVDSQSLYEQSRLPGAPDPSCDRELTEQVSEPDPGPDIIPLESGTRSRQVFWRMIRKARAASARGNVVRAAILRRRAVPYATPEFLSEATIGSAVELDRLTSRLQAALGFAHAEAESWREVLAAILAHSSRGFWNADARLLYDLQKVCVDHERETYTIDLIDWVWSLGRRPLRRPLPNQREVLMTRHLHGAGRRLLHSKLSGSERMRLSLLLHAAANSAAGQLRTRLRPQTVQSLADVGFQPQNVPERVAVHKLVEELLDGIVQRGFLTMGHLRDAISRNNLKLPDLAGPAELFTGDRLLRADRRLGTTLDGVYRGGEFYMLGLQGLSSLAFGTRTGRFITQFIVLPFGGAAVALEGLEHLLNWITVPLFDYHSDVLTVWSLVGLGSFLLGLMQVRKFRRFVWDVLRAFHHVARGVCIDIPLRISRLPAVRAILKSTPVVLLRRYVVVPLLVALTLCSGLALSHVRNAFSPGVLVGLYLLSNVILNSRVGRNTQELASEWIEHTWQQIRIHVFVALFDLVMETFKRILEGLERVLYAVDEFLRFRSGELAITIFIKAILGVIWSVCSFVIRIYVNLLIEPQVNPIKHFPVVTVSHKIILPMSLWLTHLLATPLKPIVGSVFANTLAGTTVFLLPGVFGFLVWELKENWRLYVANRPANLAPVLVGTHGETLIRLMKPGFHSGTLPKLFGKFRRAVRIENRDRQRPVLANLRDKLRHLEDSIRQFVEREFITLLDESPQWEARPLTVASIDVASNSLRIAIHCPRLSPDPLWLAFQEQSGWLVGGILDPGWINRLSRDQLRILQGALAGLYRIGGVDLIREQIEACFSPRTPPYDIAERGLTLWPEGRYEIEVTYNLDQRPVISPRPRSVARSFNLPSLRSSDLVFGDSEISWESWVRFWEAPATDFGEQSPRWAAVRLLPVSQSITEPESEPRTA